MGSYYYGNPDNSGTWEQAASIFAGHDSVNSEMTSSLALVQFWKHIKPRAEQFEKTCGLVPGELCADESSFCFEYPVPVSKNSGGKGKPSMTDLMIITERHAIAVEAKWTECKEPYQLVCKWKKDDNANRKKVLEGWLEYIEDCGYSVNHEKIDNVAYQFLHRIASACYVAKQKTKAPKVVYHLFYHDQDARKKVETFAENLKDQYVNLFNGEGTPLHIIESEVEIVLPPGMKEISKRDKKIWNELFVRMQKKNVYKIRSLKVVK